MSFKYECYGEIKNCIYPSPSSHAICKYLCKHLISNYPRTKERGSQHLVSFKNNYVFIIKKINKIVLNMPKLKEKSLNI